MHGLGLIEPGPDNYSLIGFRSSQQAEAVAVTIFGNRLWVAVNFSDTLILPNSDTLVSLGGRDFAIIGFDNELQIHHYYQVGGIFSERVDDMVVMNDMLYIYSNLASPRISIHHNDSLKLELYQTNYYGNASLISIDSNMQSALVWMIKHDWSNRLTGIHKISATETVLSGMFDRKMTVDSTIYSATGTRDVFMFRISDACIDGLKSTYHYIPFCEGDSVYLEKVYLNKHGILTYDENLKGGHYVSNPGSYSFEQRLDCGCLASDSLVFAFSDDLQYQKMAANPYGLSQLYLENTKRSITIQHLGNCELEEDNKFILKLIPNPFKDNCMLDIEVFESGKLTVEIVNMAGTLMIYTAEYSLGTGRHNIRIDTWHILPGSYVLRAIYKGKQESFTQTSVMLKH